MCLLKFTLHLLPDLLLFHVNAALSLKKDALIELNKGMLGYNECFCNSFLSSGGGGKVSERLVPEGW